jgi:DNA replication protein
MPEFKGFQEGRTRSISLPASFFSELLLEIDHLGELKVALYIFWRFNRMEGPIRFLRLTAILTDSSFMSGLDISKNSATDELLDSLQRAVKRGIILEAELRYEDKLDKIYFLNSPKGRAALRALQSGKWHPMDQDLELTSELTDEPPNIFRLYEENIGTLTPLLSDALKEAEETYPMSWIEEAIEIAVQNNKRSWRYASTILERWQREGKHGRKEKHEDRTDSEKARRRYVEGEFSEFIEH